MLAKIEALSDVNSGSPYFLAMIYLYLDDREKTFEQLENAAEAGDAWFLWWAASEPQLDPLRDDPRFIKLMRKSEPSA